jgi:hypothetical protein
LQSTLKESTMERCDVDPALHGFASKEIDMRTPRPALLASLALSLLLPANRARAAHEIGANIWFCDGDPVDFSVAVSYDNAAHHPLGYQTVETFHFGDGTSAPVTLTATELHPGPAGGWYLAEGEISHHYPLGNGTFQAGIEVCCRPTGAGGTFDLNNRRGGTLRAAVTVDPGAGGCPNSLLTPPVLWLRGSVGEMIEFGMGIHDHDPFQCRLVSDAEAGGGPTPAGMTVDPDTCGVIWTPSGDPAKMWTAQVQEERGGTDHASSLVDFLVGLDAAPALCRVDRIDPGPPVRLHIAVQDERSGLDWIAVTQAQNATVALPPFSPGEVGMLDVVATKLDASQGSRVELLVADTAGNQRRCDPILTDELRAPGTPVRHTWTGVPAAEQTVTVTNGDPGLNHLEIEVNGRKFQLTGLAAGEERTLDVSSAVDPRRTSTFTLTARGRPGGRAAVLIWDGGEP